MTERVRRNKRKQAARALGGLAAAGLMLAGCSTAGNNSAADNPGVAGPSPQYHTYVGTQSVQWSASLFTGANTFQYGGTWAVALNDENKNFSYQNVGHQTTSGQYFDQNGLNPAPISQPIATLGKFAGSSGFLALTPNGSTAMAPGAGGYALEIPGEALIMRPGGTTTAPVVAVETSACLTIKPPQIYQFISFGTPDNRDPIPHVAYGSVQGTGTGVAWSFSDLKMYGFNGTDMKPAAIPSAGCSETAEGFAISVAPAAATGNLTLTAQVTSSGYFIMDQGQGEISLFSIAPGATGPLGLVGVAQPAAQLSTSAVVGAKYLGFEFDPVNLSLNRPASLPVSFGAVAGAGTVMTGGTYANDDVTQTPTTDITIDLGAQDAQNGLYKSVTVTVPDTFKACNGQAYGGTDAGGNPTCIFHGAAVAGNPSGKYALFVTVNDVSLQTNVAPPAINQVPANDTPYGALNFVLYQQ